jgi:hypothetical protein
MVWIRDYGIAHVVGETPTPWTGVPADPVGEWRWKSLDSERGQ